MEDLLKRLDTIPPFICRVIARRKNGWEPMSLREIAEKSGLKKDRVHTISKLMSWAKVPVKEAMQYASACGVDLLHPGPHKKWLRRSKLKHVGRAHPRQMASIMRGFVQR